MVRSTTWPWAGPSLIYLSVAFILEEGLPLETLQRVVRSLSGTARDAGVAVVTGDTKVVEKGKGDGLFINTSGIGRVLPGINMSADQARPGDAIILSGSIGDHGITILSQREGLEFESPIVSDCAALHTLVAAMMAASPAIRCMRDPTRGGLSSALNEIAAQSRVGMEIGRVDDSRSRSRKGRVRIAGTRSALRRERRETGGYRGTGTCGTNSGRDARTSPGEGSASHRSCDRRESKHGHDADNVGTTRIVDMLSGDQLPRIC